MHYWRHAKPVWDALPAELRGDGECGRVYPDPGNVGLVASWADTEAIRNLAAYFYVEHGAGQCYAGDIKSAQQPGYSGSGGYRHIGCLGFISPSQRVADRWETAPSIAVGCPKLDSRLNHPNPSPKVVCLAFHWEAPGGKAIAPEARSAYEHYAPMLDLIYGKLIDDGFEVIGHAHPKWMGAIDEAMDKAGLIVYEDEDDVFDVCGSLIMDNSSIQYEFAALGRPQVVLNAPWYRLDVQHGLRFWDAIPGLQVDTPNQLARLDLARALKSGEPWRKQAVSYAYAFTDGSSSARAAQFIVNRLTETGRL